MCDMTYSYCLDLSRVCRALHHQCGVLQSVAVLLSVFVQHLCLDQDYHTTHSYV